MLAVIGSAEHFFGSNVGRLLEQAELRFIRTAKFDRIVKELKQPNKLVILDMEWEELSKGGVLRQLVNIARISANTVVCICPNQDEKLKKIAKNARASEIFIRYDMEFGFKDFLIDFAKEALTKKEEE